MIMIDGDDDSYDEINKESNKIWCNAAGECHRDGDLPAVIWFDGSVSYFRYGELHRDGDLPAVVWPDGSMEYYRDGEPHRDGDLPALIYPNGFVEYWVDGVWQKMLSGDDDSYDGIYKGCHKIWRNADGYRHRDGDLPAVIQVDGFVEYWIDGVWQKSVKWRR